MKSEKTIENENLNKEKTNIITEMTQLMKENNSMKNQSNQLLSTLNVNCTDKKVNLIKIKLMRSRPFTFLNIPRRSLPIYTSWIRLIPVGEHTPENYMESTISSLKQQIFSLEERANILQNELFGTE
ncbi:hypothetical protein A3Q56_05196 [Intoshia linei]|uniref:Uncharacterized protein n=1 Tax=Intoshia linei TaxID=1819745 RepID=A0A177AYJ8_9BILA|nr:hypothetical protein A3Q56_05196 [Intoshia linei]